MFTNPFSEIEFDDLEQRLEIKLEEYRELGLSWRADDERLSKLTRTLLPLSILALSSPALEGTDKAWYVLLIGGGVCLMSYWFFTAHIAVKKVKLRTNRMQIIEKELGMDAHLSYHRGREGQLKDATIRKVIFIVYWVVAVIVIAVAYLPPCVFWLWLACKRLKVLYN